MTDCVKGYGVCSVILIPTNDFKASGNDLQLVSCGQQIGDGVVENTWNDSSLGGYICWHKEMTYSLFCCAGEGL